MSTVDIFRMIDDARSFGIGVYNAWTAEPLLRKDLPEILHHAKEAGMITSLVTNGKLLAQRICELGDLDCLSVSVDGIESYKDLRGSEIGVVLDGIKAAKEAGHKILINCIICSKNLDEIEDLVHLAEELGVWISFEPINESRQIADSVWQELGIRSNPGYQTAVNRLIDLKRSGAPIVNSLTYLNMIRSLEPKFRCHASDMILHVEADGTIVCCRSTRAPLGSVFDGISNVWRSSLSERKKVVEDCNGCLFFGYVENSLLYEMVPEVIAHYRSM